MNLKTKFETVCEMYVEAFMRKHGFFDDRTGEYADYEWVADEVGSILCLADYFINFDDIRRDIDEEVPKDKYFEYYDHCIETERKINYKSYLMGGESYKTTKTKIIMKQTSLEAYADSREKARQHRAKILQAFRAVNKPLTISEVAEVSRLSYHQVGRRLSELTNEKRIRVSKEFGLSPTGRKAHKWELIKEEEL